MPVVGDSARSNRWDGFGGLGLGSRPGRQMPSALGATRPCRRRGAFTLIELLVVLAIIGTLLAFLLPAVMQARASARRATCQNNLRNVALAILSDATAKRRFPASGHFSLDGSQWYHSWVVELLPGLERGDLAAAWAFDRPYNDPGNLQVGRVTIPVLVCPDDLTAAGGGGLSYGVNGGFGWTVGVPTLDCPASFHVLERPPIAPMDFNGNGIVCPGQGGSDGVPDDKKLFFQTGLFFLENWPKGTGTVRHHTLDSVRDGTSNTLMLADTLRGGFDPVSAANWASPDPRRHSFYVSSYVCEERRCGPGRVDYRRANSANPPYNREAINSGCWQAEGEAPWASSYHLGGVNTAFADGRVHFLSEGIDGGVYGALASPQGTKIRGPLAQPVPGSDAF